MTRGMAPAPSWAGQLKSPSLTTTRSREPVRLLEHELAREFFALVVEQARSIHLLSAEHFTVDGTPIEAWAYDFSHTLRNNNP